MKLAKVIIGAAVTLLSIESGAHAVSYVAVYNNAFDFTANSGNCTFSTTCAAAVGAGDVFAAQKFTITRATIIARASFSEADFGVTPTDVNWGFLKADGVGGLPGTILATGADPINGSTVIGSGTYNVTQNFFDIGTVALAPGTYYFVLQAISPVFDTYLGQGVDNSGAA